LPSDDPWADRHMDLTSEGMDALIANGASFTWTPGTRFEYSNLGWGLVGRVIERVAGATPQQLITDRLLGPLGMTNTTWTRPAGSIRSMRCVLDPTVPPAPSPTATASACRRGSIHVSAPS